MRETIAAATGGAFPGFAQNLVDGIQRIQP